MKYLVLSDSHGNVDNMVRAVEREKPDGIIHLGDCWRDAEELHELFPRLPLEQVPGNCDFGRFEALERVLILDDHRVLIAHGHTMGVKTGLLRAVPCAGAERRSSALRSHACAARGRVGTADAAQPRLNRRRAQADLRRAGM